MYFFLASCGGGAGGFFMSGERFLLLCGGGEESNWFSSAREHQPGRDGRGRGRRAQRLARGSAGLKRSGTDNMGLRRAFGARSRVHAEERPSGISGVCTVPMLSVPVCFRPARRRGWSCGVRPLPLPSLPGVPYFIFFCAVANISLILFS